MAGYSVPFKISIGRVLVLVLLRLSLVLEQLAVILEKFKGKRQVYKFE